MFLKIAYPIYNFFRRYLLKFFGIKTVGVRALIVEYGKILLVKHTYRQGWYLPGGGVNAKETAEQAVIRETFEEVGGKISKRPELLGVFYNPYHGWDDYVILYKVVVDSYEKIFSREIAEWHWFDINNLPQDTSAATKKRIEEYKNGQFTDCW